MVNFNFKLDAGNTKFFHLVSRLCIHRVPLKMIFFSRSEEVSLGLREFAELALSKLSVCLAGTWLESEFNSHRKFLVLSILKAEMFIFRNW